ncbi:hypothetical protein LI328DRAFT_107576 [Trichoderma asperelloides]|nr:hypothetical protein LI328DRAFT_107576 [Trichoderma asperelloides]
MYYSFAVTVFIQNFFFFFFFWSVSVAHMCCLYKLQTFRATILTSRIISYDTCSNWSTHASLLTGVKSPNKYSKALQNSI